MNNKAIFQLILLLGIIFTGIGFSIYKNYKLKQCKVAGKASVVQIYDIVKRGSFVKYEYSIEGTKYEANESIDTKEDFNYLKSKDTIDVYINCDNHTISSYKTIN
jgi:hypothetical protein